MIPQPIQDKLRKLYAENLHINGNRCKSQHSELFFDDWPFGENTARATCQECKLVIVHALSDAKPELSEAAQSAKDLAATMESATPPVENEIAKGLEEVAAKEKPKKGKKNEPA